MSVLILTGSARPGSVSTSVANYVADAAKRLEAEATIVEVADLELPFFDATTPPSADDYQPPHESVRVWSEMVRAAEAVVWVMPEYNHSISGVQKNAIDWLYHEWKDKPLAIVAYGWYGGANVLEAVKLPLKVISPDVRATVGLKFGETLSVDGALNDALTVGSLLGEAMQRLVGEQND